MIQQQSKPSLEQNEIIIKPIKCMQLVDLISTLQKPLFDQQFQHKYKKYLNESIFIFEIAYKDQIWEIRRTLNQFQSLEYDLSSYAISYYWKSKAVPKQLRTEDSNETLQILNSFLQRIVSSQLIPARVLEFLEISLLNVPFKMKEGYMYKKKSSKPEQSYWKSLTNMFTLWRKKYFVIARNGIYYTENPGNNEYQLKECLSFDDRCDIKYGKKQTGEDNKIFLQFAQDFVEIKADSVTSYIDFLFAIFSVMKQNPDAHHYRFDSFSPCRFSRCQWYVDGEGYFNDVYNAILSAKESIYITDWWLSPELYLKRPVDVKSQDENNRTRLDCVLKAAADRGIQVLVLVYQESKWVLQLDSEHTVMTLTEPPSKVRVLRHPSQIIPKLFSHHEKMVLIDQRIAFMGGLDLCFGRWDTHEHLLFDNTTQEKLWPQIDFSNPRIKDFKQVANIEQYVQGPRMPWHDIAIQIQGDSAVDLAKHFTQYWNHVIKDKEVDGLEARKVERQVTLEKQEQKFQNTTEIVCSKSQALSQFSEELLKEIEIEEEEEKQIDIQEIIQREQTIDIIVSTFKAFLDNEEKSKQDEIRKPKIFNLKNIQKQMIQNSQDKACVTQLTRSSSVWSGGFCRTEFSIQSAYLNLIENAKNFIYIENQFFISCTAGKKVKNKIAQKLVERIVLAHQRKEKFKVIVFIPLLPGFEGEIDDQDHSAVLKVQLHWEYQTISRGGTSILEELRKRKVENVADYIQFFSLRQHSKSPTPTTEIIYIHSKLMIIDDEIALIGSANINDRSLDGGRDSELAIIVQDKDLIKSKINGNEVTVAKFAHSLRIQLYREHFGLSEEEVRDPLDQKLEEEINNRTELNSQIYRELFACYPDDEVHDLKQYAKFKLMRHPEKYEELAPQIKGHAVRFPLNFMCKEKLNLKIINKEYLAPTNTYT